MLVNLNPALVPQLWSAILKHNTGLSSSKLIWCEIYTPICCQPFPNRAEIFCSLSGILNFWIVSCSRGRAQFGRFQPIRRKRNLVQQISFRFTLMQSF